ncbi:MarR family transcriptional regulator [Rhizobium sp. BK251]|uniref:MarR family winged helix-turn-helix transcriptional regulator n=1 Tax=Rhizobium sp. BK251 TaxID=2512125 RepID=UPI0010540077|nr:MarR family transcriptional regulator [Rhizobium sp. BK251]TCL67132.1 DNA-binding MarR family transcriptional regulator [Rhizobium sp. BK251]
MISDIDASISTLALTVFRANGALIAAGDALTEPFGLSSARWQVMGAIALAGQPLTVAQIARNMGLARQSVQRLVDELQRQGNIDFEDNPQHKRAKLVRLTPAGADAYAGIMERWGALSTRLTRQMDATRIRAAIDILEQLSTGLDELRPPD